MPKRLKILLAEDELSLCRYVVTLLSRWECELAIEPTAVSAIHRAAMFEPDVALLWKEPAVVHHSIGLVDVGR